MEVYWDRIAVAYAEACPEAKVVEAPLLASRLASVGFPRRTTGPQRQPGYDYTRRAPLWDTRHQDGFYTRFGPVDELVGTVDDAVAILGPGEEVHLEFRAPESEPPPGWTRRYVLLLNGWCKDMDLYTRDGETVGPLPTREEGADTKARDALHRRYQTRFESGR
jgi:hypothetical protein